MKVELDVLFAIIALAISVGSFFIGRKTAAKNEGQESGTIMSELGYIKSGIEDIKRKQEKSEERYQELVERVIKVEESTKQAHKRISELGGKNDAS
jgi:K+/H+ antiporter YhaU regulatory subunit KhtT